MGAAFAYDTYTNPSKNNGVLGATLTLIDSLRSPFGLPAAVFLRFAPILSNLLQIRLPPIILSFMILVRQHRQPNQ